MITVKTTINPIITGDKDPDTSELYSNLDAKSLQSEIKAFQEWMVKKYPNFNSDGDIIIVSGIFDDGTKKAFAKYGVEYAAGSPIVGPTPSEKQKKNAEKRGIFWDKAKGWFTKAQQSGLFELGKSALGLPQTGPPQPQVIGGYPTQAPNNQIKDSKDNTMLYIGIGLAVLIGGGLIWHYSQKK